MRRLALLLPVLLMLGAGLQSAAANEQHGSYQENPRWGYKLRAPKNWKKAALKLDEPWIADKFFPSYPLRTRNELEQFVQHKPNVWVIGFPKEREEDRVKVEKPDEHTTIITITNPYKDYKDFVTRESWASTGRGGWYYDKEEEIEHAGYKVSIYEIKVEKLTVAPIRVVTWVYHCPDCDFAVQVRILEDHYKPNKNVVDGVVKSFREIPRTEPFPTEDAPRIRMPGEETETKTIEEINAARVAAVQKRIEREIKHLPKGWRVQRSKHFVCLTQHDRTITKYVLNFAEELRKYLDKHFASLGPAKVPPGLIRLFVAEDELAAYQQGTRGWWADEVGEIAMTFGMGRDIWNKFSSLADHLTDQYFRIKNENLRWGMPGWIRTGIWGHIRWMRPSKRKKMMLIPDVHDVQEIQGMIDNKATIPLRELMTMSGDETEGYGHVSQAKSVVYFLLNRGNKGKVKDGIAKYLKSLEQIIKEEDDKFEKAEQERWKKEAAERAAAGNPDEGKSEEELEAEEEERYRERRERRGSFNEGLKSKYAAIRERAQEAAFGHLTEKDWETVDKKWQKFAKTKN